MCGETNEIGSAASRLAVLSLNFQIERRTAPWPTGRYEFKATCSDGCHVLIGGRNLNNIEYNDLRLASFNRHVARSAPSQFQGDMKSYKATLAAGKYRIYAAHAAAPDTLASFKDKLKHRLGYELVVHWKGPGWGWKPVPARAFSHTAAVVADGTTLSIATLTDNDLTTGQHKEQ